MAQALNPICISSCFDAGNIEVAKLQGPNIEVTIKDDVYTELEKRNHKQWFYFRGNGFKHVTAETKYDFAIVNAGQCSYPDAWDGYNVCASYDRSHWFRVPTTFDKSSGHLKWSLSPEQDQVYFAYFPPYSAERHLDLIAYCNSASNREASTNPGDAMNIGTVKLTTLGQTLDGRSMDMITIGRGPRKVWCVGRQHPGESMAEFFLEGYLHRLLDVDDAMVRKLRREATFYCVPNMNPDGAFRGHLRTNACGANLNREWATSGDYVAPSLERSPEVFYVLKELDAVGCDLFMDIHGDEELPYNFISGMNGCPKWALNGERLKNLQNSFAEAFVQASPDFQTKFGYEPDAPLKANLAICSNQIAERFDCLAFTMEMPFKDTLDDPNPVTGWSIPRSIRLGKSILQAVDAILPKLR
eukprot:CAMPEP_0175003706 /NCGR_PEP_ID=MMETSP0005-20121125/4370_1 /TAXON_ID=420556 /ORGANISM="Ochromonas sp., Strain CCMP1393" /LENGTH=413 /DNA_ID=CAMNT_0016258797 /DNA_START=41 /DNA_END=1282 /DNA_ORIENTATION=-